MKKKLSCEYKIAFIYSLNTPNAEDWLKTKAIGLMQNILFREKFGSAMHFKHHRIFLKWLFCQNYRKTVPNKSFVILKIQVVVKVLMVKSFVDNLCASSCSRIMRDDLIEFINIRLWKREINMIYLVQCWAPWRSKRFYGYREPTRTRQAIAATKTLPDERWIKRTQDLTKHIFGTSDVHFICLTALDGAAI